MGITCTTDSIKISCFLVSIESPLCDNCAINCVHIFLKMAVFNSDAWNIILHSHMFHMICICGYIGSTSTHAKLLFISVLCNALVMGNCLKNNTSSSNKDVVKTLPIDTIFELPSRLPTWPSGGEFATGEVDLGGLQIRKVTTFKEVWKASDGGSDNLGATFFEPSPIPEGFSMLGSYAQPNNRPLFGWVLVGKTDASDQTGNILKQPTDYTLVWAYDQSLQTNTATYSAYFWLPIPPDGYKAVGHVITASPDKPSLDRIQCVRSDFTTDELETDTWIWAQGTEESTNGVNVYALKPKSRGTKAQPLSVGTFVIQNQTSNNNNSTLSLSCLKNKNSSLSYMPNLSQIKALFQTYSPYIYFHPKETYLPSSVNWYFSHGALLYKKGDESNPTPIQPNGSNLPQGGPNDDSYWLDLPVNEEDKERVKKGDLQSAEAYLHAKPILGGTFTDIQVWIFYPFNGPATAKLGLIKEISLGKIGEHIGDWEHLTLRISNFDGIMYSVYFAQHSGGQWVDSCSIEFQNGNKFVGYSSRNGHASYPKAGVVLQGTSSVGIRNDTAKSDKVMDCGAAFSVVAAEGDEEEEEPPWLNYTRKWGPKIRYEVADEVKKVEKVLPGNLKREFAKLVNSLPDEVYGEDGPTGPKVKDNWNGDEK